MKIKVLLVAANLKIAGAQKMIEQLVLHIDKEKFELRVLVLSPRLETIIEKRLEEAGINVKYLDKPAGFHMSFFGKVRKEVKEFEPDIIHTHVNSWLYILPSVIFDHKLFIHTIHSSPERQEANGCLRVVIKALYKTGRAIPVAISDKIREDATKVYGLPLKRIERVYNPVDYELFSSAKKKQHEKLVYVNVARFNKIKNQLFLIKVFSKVHAEDSNTKLVFAGEGELLPQAKDLAKTLNCQDCIEFCGSVDDIPGLLANCDIFVLPSLSEGMPISLIEAEAAGMPIIASNVGGIPDVVDRNGILVSVNSEDDLLDAMRHLASDEMLRESMGTRSRDIAKKFSASAITKEYEALYERYGKPQR